MSSQVNFFKRKNLELKNILGKNILIIGLGGLGSHALNSLIRLGFCNLTIIDGDIVEKSNLNRQTLFDSEDIGEKKAVISKKKALRINRGANINLVDHFIYSVEDLEKLRLKPDIILDGTDNFEIRRIINRYSLKHNIPWIMASSLGQKSNVIPFLNNEDSTCFECYLNADANHESCNRNGIINTTLMMAVSLQVNLAIKILLGLQVEECIHFLDSWDFNIQKVDLNMFKKDHCICSMTNYNSGPKLHLVCGGNVIDFRTKDTDHYKEVAVKEGLVLTRNNKLFSEFTKGSKRIVFYNGSKLSFYGYNKETVVNMIQKNN